MKGKGLRIKLNIINFLLGAGLYSSVEVLYLRSQNISSYLISILVLLVPLGTALLEVPTGIIGDKLGRKKILRLTFISFFLASNFILFAPNIVFIFIGYIFEALGFSLYSGNTEAIIYEASSKDGSDINKALSDFYSSLTIGYVVSGLLVNLLSVGNNLEILYGAVFVTAAIRLVAVALCFTVSNIDDQPADKKPLMIMNEALALVRKDKVTMSICIYDALGRLQYYLPVIYQPILISNGISVQAIALIYSLSQFAQSISQKVAAVIIDKVGIPIILKILPLIQGISLLLLLTKNTPLILIGIVLIFAGIAIKGQCTSLVRHSLVSNEIRVTYMSIISLITLLINTFLLNTVGAVLEFNKTVAIIILTSIIIIGSEFTSKVIISKLREGEIN